MVSHQSTIGDKRTNLNLLIHNSAIMNELEVKPKKSLIEYGFEEDGKHYWWASWYANVLGYKSLKTFTPVITRAKQLCVQLGLAAENNFTVATSDVGKDIKLTKFACFLVAIQADARKPVVKRARSYFLNELEELDVLLNDQDYLHRNLSRQELKRINSDLSKMAARSRVKDFQFFTNEGYLGMYNHTMPELRKRRGLEFDDNMNDYMSATELAANIFRITMTKERLKRLRNPNEAKAAKQHWKIGSQIRSMIKENTGVYPEQLPLKVDLNDLQRKLKKAQRKLNEEIQSIEQVSLAN